MSDKQRPRRTPLHARNEGHCTLNHRACQRTKRLICHAQREERRHRRLYLMPQCFKPSEAGCALAAACRHDNIVVATNIIKPFNPPSCKYSHSIAFGQLPETAAYRPGILRTWKRAAVVLCDKRHAVSLKPLKCLAGAKAFQQPLHQPMTTWVDRREVADGGKRVGAVAPSSPRQLHL